MSNERGSSLDQYVNRVKESDTFLAAGVACLSVIENAAIQEIIVKGPSFVNVAVGAVATCSMVATPIIARR